MRAKTNASEITLGMVFAAGGLGICLEAAGLRSMPGMIVGSGLFPMITGALMALLGAALAVAALIRPRSASDDDEEPREAIQMYSVIVLAGLVALTAMMPTAGFVIGGILFAGFTARLGGAGWIGSAIFAVVLTSVLYWVFVHGLRVQLPRGPLGF